MTPLPKSRAWFRPSGVELLFLIAGLVLTNQYAWLLDDAYVYFRYVDNWLLLDRGLVYNSGEFAEGFTSPAWLLLLSMLRATGLEYWLAVRIAAALCFAVFWWMAVLINRQLSPPESSVLNLPLAFLCCNYAVLCYFSSGTESPGIQIIAGAFALFVLRPEARCFAYLMAISPLIRPEFALPLVIAVLWSRWKTGRLPWELIGVAALTNGGWLIFRIWYYADLFPVTYHLKNVFEPLQGLLFVHDTLLPYHLYEFLGLGVATLVVFARRRELGLQGMERLVMLVTAALITLYVIKVGGGARHYRYLAFPICLSVFALGGLAERAWLLWGMRLPRLVGALATVLLGLWSFSLYPRQLSAHPLQQTERPQQVDLIADAEHHRTHRAIPSLEPWGSGEKIDHRAEYSEWLAAGGNEKRPSFFVERLCWKHYHRFRGWGIHAYGLTDPILARIEMPWKRPGHKLGLDAPARNLAKVYRWWDRPPAIGMFRAASEAGVTADWIDENFESIEILERKVYNEHRFWENLGLALTRVKAIDAGEPQPK